MLTDDMVYYLDLPQAKVEVFVAANPKISELVAGRRWVWPNRSSDDPAGERRRSERGDVAPDLGVAIGYGLATAEVAFGLGLVSRFHKVSDVRSPEF
jgi:hypothetical protein